MNDRWPGGDRALRPGAMTWAAVSRQLSAPWALTWLCPVHPGPHWAPSPPVAHQPRGRRLSKPQRDATPLHGGARARASCGRTWGGGPSGSAGESDFRKQLPALHTVTQSSLWPSGSTRRRRPKRNDNICPHGNMGVPAASFLPAREPKPPSDREWRGKVLCSHEGTLLTNKEGTRWADLGNALSERSRSQRPYCMSYVHATSQRIVQKWGCSQGVGVTAIGDLT